MANSVVIIGANGRLGQVLASAFAQAGWQVAAQVRRGPRIPARPGTRFVRAPLGDPAALAEETAAQTWSCTPPIRPTRAGSASPCCWVEEALRELFQR